MSWKVLTPKNIYKVLNHNNGNKANSLFIIVKRWFRYWLSAKQESNLILKHLMVQLTVIYMCLLTSVFLTKAINSQLRERLMNCNHFEKNTN